MTVKAIGHQWYWSYEYPDNGNFTFDANLNDKDDARSCACSTPTTRSSCPSNTKVRLLTTADDVIHSWAMPSFGVKLDAVPGRINETWFEVPSEGTYLRPMLGALRQRPRLHADRRRGGQQGRVRRLGRSRRRRPLNGGALRPRRSPRVDSSN